MLNVTKLWKPANGPFGEIVYALAVNYNEHIFAGTYISGVFRAKPTAGYWAQTTLASSHITSIAVSPKKIVLAGSEKGLYRSIDNGASWSLTNLNGISVQSVAVNSEGFVFAGTKECGVYKSNYDGTGWKQTSFDSGIVDAIAININDEIFASCETGIWFSDDNGSTWQRRSRGITNNDINAILITGDNIMFAGTFGGGIFISTDNGVNWSETGHSLENKKIWCLGENGKGKLFTGTEGGFFYSDDMGENWEKDNSGFPNPEKAKVYCLTMNNDGYLFAGTYGWGVFKTTVKMNGKW